MNLNAIANGIIVAVNPNLTMKVEVSTGYSIEADGTPVPAYACPVYVPGQFQALSYSDMQQINGLALQGQRRAIYLNGNIDGLVRVERKGGDLITDPAGHVWLVAMVLEYWPDWCKCAVTLQNVIPVPDAG